MSADMRGFPGLFMGPMNAIIKDSSGYNENIFEGKGEQMQKVCEHLEEKGFIPSDLVKNEVSWFYR
jgi:glutamate dehydrogenase